MNYMLVDARDSIEVGDWVRVKPGFRHLYMGKRSLNNADEPMDFAELDLRVFAADATFYTLGIIFGDRNGLLVERDHVEKIPSKEHW